MWVHTRRVISRVPSGLCFTATLTPKASNNSTINVVVSPNPTLVVPQGAAPLLLHVRDFHSRKFSRNVEFFTANDVPLPKNTKQVASTLSNHERPLTLLFCWLMAKERHVRKYAQFYTNMGIDVLKVRISPFDLLRPTKGSQVAAEQVLEFLHANPTHSPLLVHGLSVGGYLFMEVLNKIDDDMEKHGHLLNRFVGQIWDSGVDIYGIPDGVPRAITNNVSLQRNIKKYLLWHLKVNYNTATVHYERASRKMHENFLGVPGLFFFSNNDPVSTPEMNALVYKKWEANNIPVYTRCWKDSVHVSHYLKHRKEYEAEVVAFMERVGMIEPSRQRATSL
ncbi:uncharacterized protein LOC126981073 isoform X1 [Eriocheir sinensis]|uniref:uncharacterized protein LOC126981073 isoform X1 n=1 Tax=Eriocheir sinensis TaxID=95602 RepID=UPI0021C68408|nr:uncharacterized protein LOC126981073 isoform X1 [Eriocheir sinensis]XP_050687711.1 uncharacterized protein LOC126981073 isoform X1 [Eriocheir sinensis]